MRYTGVCARLGIFNGGLCFVNRSFRFGVDHGRIRFNGRYWLLNGRFFPFDIGNILSRKGCVFCFRDIIRRNGSIIAVSLNHRCFRWFFFSVVFRLEKQILAVGNRIVIIKYRHIQFGKIIIFFFCGRYVSCSVCSRKAQIKQ